MIEIIRWQNFLHAYTWRYICNCCCGCWFNWLSYEMHKSLQFRSNEVVKTVVKHVYKCIIHIWHASLFWLPPSMQLLPWWFAADTAATTTTTTTRSTRPSCSHKHNFYHFWNELTHIHTARKIYWLSTGETVNVEWKKN